MKSVSSRTGVFRSVVTVGYDSSNYIHDRENMGGGGDACTTNPYIYMCKLFSKRMFYWPAIISIETLFRLVSISSSFKNTSLHYASCSLICVDIAN